jgi:hypothetical protein
MTSLDTALISEYFDRMQKAEAKVRELEQVLQKAMPILHDYACRNQKWYREGIEQDPNGVYGLLETLASLHVTDQAAQK